jgi:hypothetical protein
MIGRGLWTQSTCFGGSHREPDFQRLIPKVPLPRSLIFLSHRLLDYPSLRFLPDWSNTDLQAGVLDAHCYPTQSPVLMGQGCLVLLGRVEMWRCKASPYLALRADGLWKLPVTKFPPEYLQTPTSLPSAVSIVREASPQPLCIHHGHDGCFDH